MLKLLGIIALVALILVGSLMPLKYLSSYGLPKKKEEASTDDSADGDHPRDEE